MHSTEIQGRETIQCNYQKYEGIDRNKKRKLYHNFTTISSTS